MSSADTELRVHRQDPAAPVPSASSSPGVARGACFLLVRFLCVTVWYYSFERFWLSSRVQCRDLYGGAL